MTNHTALDVGAITGAVVAGVGLAHAALLLTVVSAFVSILLGGIRIYDRLKYGPGRR